MGVCRGEVGGVGGNGGVGKRGFEVGDGLTQALCVGGMWDVGCLLYNVWDVYFVMRNVSMPSQQDESTPVQDHQQFEEQQQYPCMCVCLCLYV